MKEIGELYKLVMTGNPTSIWFIVLVTLFFIVMIIIYIVAFFQGREISFWPPKIGSNGQNPQQNASISQSNENSSNLEPSNIDSLYRTYEWQWAGEKWYGRIELAKSNNKNVINQATVGELKKVYGSDGSFLSFEMKDKVIELDHGEFRTPNADELEIDLVVKKRVINSNDYMNQTIRGVLSRKQCFAGKVKYWDPSTGDTYWGNMVLVDYHSVTDEQIENWFLKEK